MDPLAYLKPVPTNNGEAPLCQNCRKYRAGRCQMPNANLIVKTDDGLPTHKGSVAIEVCSHFDRRGSKDARDPVTHPSHIRH